MSAGQLSVLEEYDAIYEELGDHGAGFWKFFDCFRIVTESSENEIKGIYYVKDAHWTHASDEHLKQLKSYWREQRKWIKKEGKGASPHECRRRMWFFSSKLNEWGIFDARTRHFILYWMDTCEERTLEPAKPRATS
jgi:hypothetical protein